MENVQTIDDINARNLTWTAAVNQFTDLTAEEFAAVCKGYKGGTLQSLQRTTNNNATTANATTALNLNAPSFNASSSSGGGGGDLVPDAWNWTAEGAVTPVKEQQKCGCSWAFSAVGSLEGMHFRKTGQLVSLSAQHLCDCVTTAAGCVGCGGGLMLPALEYAQTNGGVDTEDSYPFLSGVFGVNFGACLSDLPQRQIGATVAGVVELPSGDEEALKTAIYRMGPIAVAVDASQKSFQFYGNGTYVDPNCKNDSASLNHAVTAVGYGTDANGPFWYVKNSWGTEWGLDGFMKIARNANNTCGIATEACYPVV